MIAQKNDAKATAMTAMLCAGAMIAQQVSGKAARDTFFLSNFDVTTLPLMMIAAALFAILMVLWASRVLSLFGPWRVMPFAFSGSAAGMLILWALSGPAPGLAAVLLYLHVAALGSILVSGFWSVVNEALDPRTARREIGRVGAAAALGGLCGGLLAERFAANFPVTLILPALAALHLFCGSVIGRLKPLPASRPPRPGRSLQGKAAAGSPGSVALILHQAPYLRNLATLVLVVTMAAALLDYVFKVRATESFTDSASLMRFFAIFYTGIGLITFLVQLFAGRLSMERLGLSATVSTHPLAIGLGSVGALLGGGLISVTAARSAEAILRSSLFRSAYEALFTPISKRDKRATKTIVDVGFERAGDVLGGGSVRLLLLLPSALAIPVMLLAAGVLAMVAFVLARQLQIGYVEQLKKRLLSGAFRIDPEEIGHPMTRSMMMQTMATMALQRPELQKLLAESRSLLTESGRERAQTTSESLEDSEDLDPSQRRIAALRSGDPARVVEALEAGPVSAELAPAVVPLLAWDTVYEHAVKALIQTLDQTVSVLAEALLDPEEEFAIRRRLPRVLSHCREQAAVDALLQGLFDRRFEVRFRCGRALARIQSHAPSLQFDRERIFDAVLRETDVDRRVWASQRLLDQLDEPDAPFVDEYLRDRSSRSLEHVFTMLSLVHEAKPLQIAYKGLHTNDPMLRGTALEYLESTLRAEIRAALWPFLEADTEKSSLRGRDEILDSLMNSHQSIKLNLARLRDHPPKQA